MQYIIENELHSPYLRLIFEKKEKILAEPGSLYYITSGLNFENDREFNPNSLKDQIQYFDSVEKTLFVSKRDGAELSLAPSSLSSQILELDLDNQTIYCDGMSYLASSHKFNFEIQGNLRQYFAGNGLFLQKVEGSGKLFLTSFGSITLKELDEGESLIIDAGHLIAFESTVNHKLLRPKKGMADSSKIGEWLVAKFEGPGKLWLSSRNKSEFAKVLLPYIKD